MHFATQVCTMLREHARRTRAPPPPRRAGARHGKHAHPIGRVERNARLVHALGEALVRGRLRTPCPSQRRTAAAHTTRFLPPHPPPLHHCITATRPTRLRRRWLPLIDSLTHSSRQRKNPHLHSRLRGGQRNLLAHLLDQRLPSRSGVFGCLLAARRHGRLDAKSPTRLSSHIPHTDTHRETHRHIDT
jgi:hypothetical protein